MNAARIAIAALAAIILAQPLFADYLAPATKRIRPCAPDACGPGFPIVNQYGTIFYPSYNVYPCFPPEGNITKDMIQYVAEVAPKLTPDKKKPKAKGVGSEFAGNAPQIRHPSDLLRGIGGGHGHPMLGGLYQSMPRPGSFPPAQPQPYPYPPPMPTYPGHSYPYPQPPVYPQYGGPAYPQHAGPAYPQYGGPAHPQHTGPAYPAGYGQQPYPAPPTPQAYRPAYPTYYPPAGSAYPAPQRPQEFSTDPFNEGAAELEINKANGDLWMPEMMRAPATGVAPAQFAPEAEPPDALNFNFGPPSQNAGPMMMPALPQLPSYELAQNIPPLPPTAYAPQLPAPGYSPPSGVAPVPQSSDMPFPGYAMPQPTLPLPPGYIPPPPPQHRCFPSHPFCRSPRDFFMWRENMEDRAQRRRPAITTVR